MIYNFFYPGKYNNYLKTVNSKAKISSRTSDGSRLTKIQIPDPKNVI